jgi:hypothetical protein
VILILIEQLHWLVREPRWHHSQLSRVPDTLARSLPSLDLPWSRALAAFW